MTESTTIKKRAQRNRSIDSLRGLAALSVLLYHMNPAPGVSLGNPAYNAFIAFWGAYGRLGVDLFFILSGFCIHWGYSKPETKVITGKYLQRRFWRIYPPYFFAFGLAVVFNLITNSVKLHGGGNITWENFGPFQIITHFFLVHNLWPASTYTISGPFWTIAVEAQFYIIYLLARPFFFSKKGWAAIFLTATVMYLVASWFFVQDTRFQPLNLFLYWPEWLLGALVAYLLRNYTGALRHWPQYSAAFIACWIGVLLAEHYGLNGTFFNVGGGLTAASFFFLTLIAIRFENIWNRRFLEWLPICGAFSYSLYLVHFPVMDRWRTFLLPAIPTGWMRLTASLISFVVCLLYAYVFYLFFEKPFLQKAALISTHQAPIEFKELKSETV